MISEVHRYNKHININNLQSLKIKHEKLWREDNAYDIIIVISHNDKPTIKNKGSAIFIHCSFSDNRKTAGCIALKRRISLSAEKSGISYLSEKFEINI